MKLVDTYLADARDDLALLDHGELAIALIGLAEAYNNVAVGTPAYAELTTDTTGGQLKSAISALKLPMQVDLMYFYSGSRKGGSGLSRPMPLLPTVPDTVPAPIPSSNPAAVVSVPLATTPVAAPRPMDNPTNESEEIERRKLRAWLVKGAFWAVAPIPCLVVGAMIAIGVRSGQMPDGVVVSSIMSTATEILKLLFNS